MQALCGCRRYKSNAKDRLWFPLQAIYISHPKHLSTRAAPASRTPGLLSSTTTVSTLFRCGNSLSPHLSCYPSRKSRLEGGRSIYVVLTTFVGPDPELYMTEYATIRIVFTLRGLYTCTHSPRIQPGISRLSPRHQSTKLTATAPSCSRFGAHPPAEGRPGL